MFDRIFTYLILICFYPLVISYVNSFGNRILRRTSYIIHNHVCRNVNSPLFSTKATSNPQVLEIYRKAQSCIKRGENYDANKLLQKCVEINPYDAHSWLSLARLEANLGHYEQARVFFRRGISYCKDNTYILHAWGHMEQKQGNISEARDLWSKALKIEPFNAYVCHALSQLEKNVGNYEKAIAILENVIRYRPTTELYISLADMYTLSGKPELSKSILLGILDKAYRDKSKILLSLANLEEIEFKNDNKAIQLLDEALQLDNENVKIYIAKASIELRKGNDSGAINILKRASQLNASDGKHFTMWSTIELMAGNYDKAREILEMGSKSFPGDPFLLQRWGTVEAKYGSRKKARQLFAKSILIRPHSPTFVAWAILEESEIYNV